MFLLTALQMGNLQTVFHYLMTTVCSVCHFFRSEYGLLIPETANVKTE